MKKSSLAAILIWFLYGAAAGSSLFLAAMSVSAALGCGAFAGLAAGILVLLAVGAAVWGLHRLLRGLLQRSRLSQTDERGQLLAVIAQSLCVLACLVGMVALRLGASWDVAADPVFEQAQVTAEDFRPAAAHGGMELYLYLLHGVCFLVGNKAFAAIFVQLALLTGAAVGLYLGIRRLSGPAAALTVVAFLGFGPYMLAETRRLSPFLLFLCVFGPTVGYIASLPDRIGRLQQKSRKVFETLYCIGAGLFIGFGCYLDMAGIILLVILTGVICFGRERAVGREYNAVTVFLKCIGASALGYAASHFLRSLGGGSMFASIGRQLELYLPGQLRIPMAVEPGAAFWDVPVLLLLMAVGVFGFWCCQEIRDKAVWLFTAAVLVGMQCFGISCTEYFNGYALLYLLCAAMAGCSVDDLWTAGEEGWEAEDTEVAYGEAEEAGYEKEPDAEGSGMVFVDVEPKPPYRVPGINYIENPLPLPKKREHKAMDYDYEVADDDDFDIR